MTAIEEQRLNSVAAALVIGAKEHGTPNGFAPSELIEYGCVLGKMAIGRVARNYAAELNTELAKSGYQMRYTQNCRFEVT